MKHRIIYDTGLIFNEIQTYSIVGLGRSEVGRKTNKTEEVREEYSKQQVGPGTLHQNGVENQIKKTTTGLLQREED